MCFKSKVFILMVLAILGFSAGTVYAEKVAVLDDLLKPRFLYVDTDRIYVIEEFTVFIYSLDDYRLIHKFGKKGEGPKEFNGFVRLVVNPDNIFVNSRGKVSYYSKEGQFIKEKRPVSISWYFKPIESKFVGYSFSRSENGTGFRTICLYDENLKKEKELIRHLSPVQPSGKIDPIKVFHRPRFFVKGDTIFAQSLEDGEIDCFDKNGQALRTIVPPIDRVKFPSEKEKELRNFFANDQRFRADWEREKARIEFPGYYPLVKYFQLTDDKIYIVTYKEIDEPHHFECLVLDLEGNLEKRSRVHIQTNSPLELDEFPYRIKGGKFYQVVENADDEEMELHITDI